MVLYHCLKGSSVDNCGAFSQKTPSFSIFSNLTLVTENTIMERSEHQMNLVKKVSSLEVKLSAGHS